MVKYKLNLFFLIILYLVTKDGRTFLLKNLKRLPGTGLILILQPRPRPSGHVTKKTDPPPPKSKEPRSEAESLGFGFGWAAVGFYPLRCAWAERTTKGVWVGKGDFFWVFEEILPLIIFFCFSFSSSFPNFLVFFH